MNTKVSLSTLNEGQEAKVDTILSNSTIRRRLQDIGIVNGTIIKCMLKSPSGDPVAYLIKGALIALRQEDAEKIIVIF